MANKGIDRIAQLESDARLSVVVFGSTEARKWLQRAEQQKAT